MPAAAAAKEAAAKEQQLRRGPSSSQQQQQQAATWATTTQPVSSYGELLLADLLQKQALVQQQSRQLQDAALQHERTAKMLLQLQQKHQ
jgi:hypothetical protein